MYYLFDLLITFLYLWDNHLTKEIQMPNDLTIADVQQLIRQEFDNKLEEVKRNQPVITTNGTQTAIDYRAVCDFMSGQIFDFCVTSDNQEVRNFGRDLCQQLAQRFNIPNRWNV